MGLGRRLAVRVVARGLRGGIPDDLMEQVLRKRFPHRGSGWRWEVIGDAHIRNGQVEVGRAYREWRGQ